MDFRHDCSRRTFLETTFAGATGLLLASGRPARAEDDLTGLTLQEAAALVRQGKLSPVELTRACLARIEALNPMLNAFITVTADSALADARRAEAEVQRGGWRGPLHGIPIALKDMFDIAGVRSTGASALFKDRVTREDAPAVQRLRDAGAVLLGTLNMYELAFGPGTRAGGYFGRVRNPWATEHIAGGSSAGSAAAVAARLCFAALGSDSGGSIRQPASFCGIVGLKPTYGRVSTRGMIPLSWSVDHVGPMTRSVVDAAIVLRAIAGHDPLEDTSFDVPVEDYAEAAARPAERVRIGVPRDHFYAGLDPEVGPAIERALATLVERGAERREVTIEVSRDRMVIQAEAYAYHSEYIAKHPELYLPETLAKLKIGEGIAPEAYMKARLKLDRHRREASKPFEAVDVLATPTTPVPAPRAADLPTKFDDIMANDAVMWRNTRPFNLSGVPTISIPCGFTKSGLPIGLQLSGAPWREDQVLRLAHTYEKATTWHTRRPPL